jgi:hypothetical protein
VKCPKCRRGDLELVSLCVHAHRAIIMDPASGVVAWNNTDSEDCGLWEPTPEPKNFVSCPECDWTYAVTLDEDEEGDQLISEDSMNELARIEVEGMAVP